VRSLQVLGAVPLTVWGAFQVPALGLYATREGLCAQAFVLLALIGSALWTTLRHDPRGGGPANGRAPAGHGVAGQYAGPPVLGTHRFCTQEGRTVSSGGRQRG